MNFNLFPILALVALSLVGCGKKNNNDIKFDSNQEASWPNTSPEMVVVKVDVNTGRTEYATNKAVYGESHYQDMIRNNELNFQDQNPGSVILNNYPERPEEQLYFVENVDNYKRGTNDSKSHYYPTSGAYQYEYMYQPAWYWNSVYYYKPTYSYKYRNCNYYVYVR